jgi:hypothetical protein
LIILLDQFQTFSEHATLGSSVSSLWTGSSQIIAQYYQLIRLGFEVRNCCNLVHPTTRPTRPEACLLLVFPSNSNTQKRVLFVSASKTHTQSMHFQFQLAVESVGTLSGPAFFMPSECSSSIHHQRPLDVIEKKTERQ